MRAGPFALLWLIGTFHKQEPQSRDGPVYAGPVSTGMGFPLGRRGGYRNIFATRCSLFLALCVKPPRRSAGQQIAVGIFAAPGQLFSSALTNCSNTLPGGVAWRCTRTLSPCPHGGRSVPSSGG
jgi:hypothetical protein